MAIYITGLDLSDGKSILLLAPEHMEDEDLFALQRELNERFSNCRFTILSGGFQSIATTNKPHHYEIEE
jgi:hypothetical protein